MLAQRTALLHASSPPSPLPDAARAMLSPVSLLSELAVLLEALRQSLLAVRCTGDDYQWVFQVTVCLDLTLSDRSAIVVSETDGERVYELLREVQAALRSGGGDEMNEFATATRTSIGLMKDRIEYNTRFEKNRVESVKTMKAALNLGATKQTDMAVFVTPTKKAK